jgi:hypothetical protein
MTIQTTARNATLDDMVALLRDQHARKLDVVAPATNLRSRGGLIHIKGAEQQITMDGVTAVDGVYRPTGVFDEGVADKLGMPLAYVRKLRNERPDLYDANVNGWLHGKTVQRLVDVSGPDADGRIKREARTDVIAEADSRSFLVRAFRDDEGGTGVVRALLSNGYGVMDNLDALVAVLDGVQQAGVDVEVGRCDLTDRRLYVQIKAPAIAAAAPTLLRGYRSPFTGQSGDQLPTVFAGLVLRNSEVGDGAWSLAPQVIVQVCANGMTVTRDAVRAVHIGSKLSDGVINWSADTATKNAELVVAKTRDAVASFLSPEWLNGAVADLEAKAGAPVEKAQDTITTVVKRLGFPQSHIDGILDHFIRGGQVTAGGVAQAITSYSQTVDDADLAHEMDAKAIDAMELVAG